MSLWIAGVEEGDPEVNSDGVNCLAFYEAMSAVSDQSCGEWNAVGGRRIWVVTKSATGRFFAVVWQQTSGFNWVPRLRLLEPEAGTWDSVVMKAADIDSGPNQELVAGIRYAGSGGYLDIDVIDAIGGNPKVVAHVEGANKGIAYTESKLGVWIWNAEFGPTDPFCCPSAFSQFLLSSDGGTWILDRRYCRRSPGRDPVPERVLRRSYRLRDTACALRQLDSGHTRGKIVITL